MWVACALLAANVILADLFREHVQHRVEAELETHLDQLTAMLGTAAPDGQLRLVGELSDPRFRRPLSGLYWQVDGPSASAAAHRRSRRPASRGRRAAAGSADR